VVWLFLRRTNQTELHVILTVLVLYIPDGERFATSFIEKEWQIPTESLSIKVMMALLNSICSYWWYNRFSCRTMPHVQEWNFCSVSTTNLQPGPPAAAKQACSGQTRTTRWRVPRKRRSKKRIAISLLVPNGSRANAVVPPLLHMRQCHYAFSPFPRVEWR